MSSRFDAITLEVLWTRIISVVDEAAKAIVRTSFSTLSNEANDFACVLTDARGFALAQNSGSIPSFIGDPARDGAAFPARAWARRHAARATSSSPTTRGMGTGHMSDVCLVKPIFHGGRPRRVLRHHLAHARTSAGACGPSRRARCSRRASTSR